MLRIKLGVNLEVKFGVKSKTGSKNSVLTFLKCMDGFVLAFLKCRDGLYYQSIFQHSCAYSKGIEISEWYFYAHKHD